MNNQAEYFKQLEDLFSDLYQFEHYKEKMYFIFSEIPIKSEFINYVKNEYLLYLKDKIENYKKLEGNYYRNIEELIQKQISFLESWIIEKEVIYKTKEANKALEQGAQMLCYKNRENQHGVKSSIDFSIEEVDKEIEIHNETYFIESLTPLAIGSLSVNDVIRNEIVFHNEKKKIADQLGFGNSSRFAIHCLNVLNQLLLKTFESKNKIYEEEQRLPIKLKDLITHKSSVELIEEIKIQYKNIRGKNLKLLLMAMQDLDLLPKDRISAKFHRCCKNEFNWDVASYNAMNGYRYNEITDKDEYEKIKSFLSNKINNK